MSDISKIKVSGVEYGIKDIQAREDLGNLGNRVSAIEGKEAGWNSKYSKPTGGIPKTDLANDVQASLGKAETALQEHQSLAAYRTSAAQDIIDNGKQDKLIAGENITISADGKTISATGGVQPDWNQNDSTAADYVKNRPFYTGDPVEAVLVEENTVSFAAGPGGLRMAEFPSTFSATVGETYKVSWDGTIYECICVDAGGAPAIGNTSIAGAGSDTGEPFVMVVMNGAKIYIYTSDTSASHTFSISGIIAQVVKINTKYLPELPYMGKVNPTGTGSFSLNRKANTAVGENSFAEGEDTTASGDASHAEGDGTIASGFVAHAEGFNSEANARFSHAEGCHTIVSDTEIDVPSGAVEDGLGRYGHAEGFGTLVTGQHGAHAEGCKTLSSGSSSHAEGRSTTASSTASHAEGEGTAASGEYSHAEGYHTTASGGMSHAEGYSAVASGAYSHAEGLNSTASGDESHAEGHYTIASGFAVHAEGHYTTASGDASHAEGDHTVASSNYQHVQGRYNIEDSSNTYAHIVGNGSSDTERSNAHTLDWSGNAWFAGTVEGTALIIPSSTSGSTKKFKITVDDSGTISATEIV